MGRASYRGVTANSDAKAHRENGKHASAIAGEGNHDQGAGRHFGSVTGSGQWLGALAAVAAKDRLKRVSRPFVASRHYVHRRAL